MLNNDLNKCNYYLRFPFIISINFFSEVSNGPSGGGGGGGGGSGGGGGMPSGGLGGIFGAGGIPKLRPAGDRRPGGGGKVLI